MGDPMMFSFKAVILTVVLPAILSASNNSPKEEANESNLAEIIQFLKDNQDMRWVVASFAVGRNEFENATDHASIPSTFSDVKWPVKIRFDITHTIYGTTTQGQWRCDTEKIRRHKTNGYYRRLDDADPIYKKLAAEPRLADLSPGIFVQDGPNGFSKGFQFVDIVRRKWKMPKIQIQEDAENGKGAYLIMRMCSDLTEESPWDLRQESPWDLQFAGAWVLHFCSDINSDVPSSYPLCYSNAKGPLPPAFGRDWISAHPAPPILPTLDA